jgi:hypothetical protein
MTRSHRDTLAHVHDLAVAAMVAAGGTAPAGGGWRLPVPLREARGDALFTPGEEKLLAAMPERLVASIRKVFVHLAASSVPSGREALAGGCSARRWVKGTAEQAVTGLAAGSAPSGACPPDCDQASHGRSAGGSVPSRLRACAHQRKFDGF